MYTHLHTNTHTQAIDLPQRLDFSHACGRLCGQRRACGSGAGTGPTGPRRPGGQLPAQPGVPQRLTPLGDRGPVPPRAESLAPGTRLAVATKFGADEEANVGGGPLLGTLSTAGQQRRKQFFFAVSEIVSIVMKGVANFRKGT